MSIAYVVGKIDVKIENLSTNLEILFWLENHIYPFHLIKWNKYV